MYIEIDFESDEAIYLQLRNQIVLGIATNQYREGESRQLAESIGINMHTVNKAYHVLRQEGFIRLDRRNGAVIFLEEDKSHAVLEMQETLQMLLAKAVCKNVTRGEVHELVDEIYDRLTGGTNA